MIRALLLAGILGFLLGVAATFVFFQAATPERAFPPTATQGENVPGASTLQPDPTVPPSSPASTSGVPPTREAPAGPPPTREELDEDD
jgi:hypothetical protein